VRFKSKFHGEMPANPNLGTLSTTLHNPVYFCPARDLIWTAAGPTLPFALKAKDQLAAKHRPSCQAEIQ
jgi:hypothetical protein